MALFCIVPTRAKGFALKVGAFRMIKIKGKLERKLCWKTLDILPTHEEAQALVEDIRAAEKEETNDNTNRG